VVVADRGAEVIVSLQDLVTSSGPEPL